jgi:hypothetical protein
LAAHGAKYLLSDWVDTRDIVTARCQLLGSRSFGLRRFGCFWSGFHRFGGLRLRSSGGLGGRFLGLCRLRRRFSSLGLFGSRRFNRCRGGRRIG